MTDPATTISYRCRGVSSDCMPVDAWAELSLDATSGLISARLDEAWAAEVKRIYENYAIYAQAAGAEQLVFDQRSGASASRSTQIVDRALAPRLHTLRGRCLDVGCGNGAFLRAFGARFPAWKLEGTEFDEKSLPILRKIPGFERLHTATTLEQLPRAYHVVSMVHVLEHLTDPLTWLAQARRLLVDDGVLLIQVPYFVENPFELAIYDHCSHFTQASLRRLVQAAGFEILHLGSDLVPKEITLVARPVAATGTNQLAPTVEALSVEAERLRLAGMWLDETLALAAAAIVEWQPERRPCALFGSSIAATLIHTHCGNAFDTFIDEDRNRQGSAHLGVPIVDLASVPDAAGVFVGLTPTIAHAVKQRALPRSSEWVVPAAFPAGLAEPTLH